MSDWESMWNDTGLNLPWIVDSPEKNLLQFFGRYNTSPLNALDIGCGHGYHTSIIAKNSNVIGIDISRTAIEIAKSLYPSIDFHCIDVLDFKPNKQFDLIYDKGCFHHLDSRVDMVRYINLITDLLSNEGYWLCLAGKKYDKPEDFKLPQLKLKDYVEMIEPFLDIVEIQSTTVLAINKIQLPAWKILGKRYDS